ncbi:hypothetical protein AB0A95_21655 [Micromonospora sp. NPDC049230]
MQLILIVCAAITVVGAALTLIFMPGRTAPSTAAEPAAPRDVDREPTALN